MSILNNSVPVQPASEMPESSSSEVVVVAIQMRSAELDHWIHAAFYTQDALQKDDRCSVGFETGRQFSINELLQEGAVIRLEPSPRIRHSERVWLTDTGDVYVSDAEDPVGDPRKRLVLEGSNYPKELIPKEPS